MPPPRSNSNLAKDEESASLQYRRTSPPVDAGRAVLGAVGSAGRFGAFIVAGLGVVTAGSCDGGAALVVPRLVPKAVPDGLCPLSLGDTKGAPPLLLEEVKAAPLLLRALRLPLAPPTAAAEAAADALRFASACWSCWRCRACACSSGSYFFRIASFSSSSGLYTSAYSSARQLGLFAAECCAKELICCCFAAPVGVDGEPATAAAAAAALCGTVERSLFVERLRWLSGELGVEAAAVDCCGDDGFDELLPLPMMAVGCRSPRIVLIM